MFDRPNPFLEERLSSGWSDPRGAFGYRDDARKRREIENLKSLIRSCPFPPMNPCGKCEVRLEKIKQLENSMNISTNIEKYVVMTTGGNFQGSWEKEKDAIMAVRRMIKNNNGRDVRYIVLEAKKEIGTKSPEIEIEDIK